MCRGSLRCPLLCRCARTPGRGGSVVSRIKGLGRGVLLLALAVLVVVVTVSAASAATGPTAVTAGGVSPERPAVSGNRVVWPDFRRGQWDIWLYDGATGQTKQITSGPGDKTMPAISGETVVYVVYGATTGADIYAYDIATGSTRAITTNNGDQLSPTISGNWVAWADYGTSSFTSKIAGMNLSNGTYVTVGSGTTGMREHPQAAGDWIVYEGNAGKGDWNVFAYNCTTGKTTVVANSLFDERFPTTDGLSVA
ncbi:MAG: hypothetical protein FDZ75_02270, partial [Actinobacteria bacterium]